MISVVDVPRMQLSEEVKKYLSADFIEKTNQWLLEFFGTEERVMLGGPVKLNPLVVQPLFGADGAEMIVPLDYLLNRELPIKSPAKPMMVTNPDNEAFKKMFHEAKKTPEWEPKWVQPK